MAPEVCGPNAALKKLLRPVSPQPDLLWKKEEKVMEKYEKPSMEIVDVKNMIILTSGCDAPGDEYEGPMMGDGCPLDW